MLLVIDTNVLVSALKSKDKDGLATGKEPKAARLIKEVFKGNHQMVVSSAVLEEYRDVLHRDYLKIDPFLVDLLLRTIEMHSIKIEPLPTTPDQLEMKDEDDRIFFDLAKCVGAKLVTFNFKDYPVHELRTSIDEIIK